jgi:hypothetical protein
MKANESNNPISPKLQQLRRDHEIGSSNRLTLASILEKLGKLQPAAVGCQSQHKELVGGLFCIIEEAERLLLSLTGAPGFITQEELEFFERYAGDRREFWWKNLLARHESGYQVEPGKFFMCRDRVGLNMGRDRMRGLRQASAAHQDDSPRPAQIETPTPAQLQAWFDLPSEPPQAPAPQGRS